MKFNFLIKNVFSVLKSPRSHIIFIAILLFTGNSIIIAGANGSPIVIDLNNDNKINTTGLNTSRIKVGNLLEPIFYVNFDLNGTGTTEEKIEWLEGSTDGFLLDMRNIDFDKPLSGLNLFGTAGGYNNGFEKLIELDSNNDGIISGVEMSELGIWRDNGDAIFEMSELKTFKEFGIYSIAAIPEETFGLDGRPLLTSTAASTHGSYYVEDVWFSHASDIWNVDRYVALVNERLDHLF